MKRKTIGDAINEKAQQYIAMYDRFCKDPIDGTDPATLAKHDLVMEIYINEEALEIVKAHIVEVESENSNV